MSETDGEGGILGCWVTICFEVLSYFLYYIMKKATRGGAAFLFGVCFPIVRDRLYINQKFVHSSANT